MQRMQKGLSALMLVVLAVLIMGCPNESSGSDNGSSSSGAVTLISVTQTGGTDDTTTSTGIDIVFSKAITGLTADHITLTGATKDALTGSGANYNIKITGVIVENEGNVAVAIAGVPDYTITPATMDAMVYVLKDIIAPNVSNVSMIIADDGKTLTVTGAIDVGGIASCEVAELKIGDVAVTLTGGTWNRNVYTHTGVITSATSAALTYASVTVTDYADNASVASSSGVVKGIGGGYAYYAVDAGGDFDSLDIDPDTNLAINGWYEISEELAGTHLWDAAQTAASAYTGTGWKLPSIAELKAAYVSLYKGNDPLDGSTLNSFLWSSSEGTNWTNGDGNEMDGGAFVQGFHNGSITNNEKSYDNNVRAVRAF